MPIKSRYKLKPCVVFDIDDTLVHTPDIDWANPKGDFVSKLCNAVPIKQNVFLYHAIDYMVNDPPIWVRESPEETENWPQEIFFATARPEYYREETVRNLCELTKDSGTAISKRLLMRPYNSDSDISHKDFNSSYDVKSFACKRLKERGYHPVLVFDNDLSSIQAYLDNEVQVLHHTVASNKDKKEMTKRIF